MSYSRAYNPILHFDDNNGHPLENGWLYTFLAGTSTPIATAANEDGTAMNPVNIRLDSRGECEAWLDTSKKYKFEIWNSTRTLSKTVDNVSAGYGGSGGGGVSPSDLKTLTLKKGNRVLGTYSPLEQKSIDVSESIVFLDERSPGLYQAITQLLVSDMIPVLMRNDIDSDTPGVTRDFYYYPTARTGADSDYSFIGYDGSRTEIATVRTDNSVSYRTVPNGVHRLMEVYGTVEDPAPYGYWIVDMERPNPDAPSGYDWANAHDLLEGARNGEIYVLYPYQTILTTGDSPVLHMTRVENQSGVDSLGNPYEAVRIFFDTCTYRNHPGTYAMTSIYTPDWTSTTHTGRIAVLDWYGVPRPFMDFEIADASTVELKSNKVQSLDSNSNHYPSCPAVKDAIDTAVAAAYHAAGTKTVAELTVSLLVAANQGNVYNITDSGTTTADFIDGAGHPIVAGDNVGVCDVGGGVYKFDLLSGFVNLSGYLAKTGNGSDVTAAFTAASTRTNISTGEKLSALFGKIAKWFGDLKALAFKDTVSDSDISGTISDAHIASASAWNAKADDNAVVHLAGAETITGQKTFASNYGPKLLSAQSHMMRTAILYCTRISYYSTWTQAQKDGNHYRQWTIDLTPLLSRNTHLMIRVKIKSSWSTEMGTGEMVKEICAQTYQGLVAPSIKSDYLVANGSCRWQFRISDVMYENNKFVIKIINNFPESNNFPVYCQVDYSAVSNVGEPTVSEAIVEGWPTWAGDKNAPVRVTASGFKVLTEDNIADNLTSTSTSNVLSANQGRVLKDLIDGLQQQINQLQGS